MGLSSLICETISSTDRHLRCSSFPIQELASNSRFAIVAGAAVSGSKTSRPRAGSAAARARCAGGRATRTGVPARLRERAPAGAGQHRRAARAAGQLRELLDARGIEQLAVDEAAADLQLLVLLRELDQDLRERAPAPRTRSPSAVGPASTARRTPRSCVPVQRALEQRVLDHAVLVRAGPPRAACARSSLVSATSRPRKSTANSALARASFSFSSSTSACFSCRVSMLSLRSLRVRRA